MYTKQEKTFRFSLRKASFGLVSVAIAGLFLLANPQNAAAEQVAVIPQTGAVATSQDSVEPVQAVAEAVVEPAPALAAAEPAPLAVTAAPAPSEPAPTDSQAAASVPAEPTSAEPSPAPAVESTSTPAQTSPVVVVPVETAATPQVQAAKDVTSQMTDVNIKIDSQDVVRPFDADKLTLSYDMKVNGTVQGGDFFIIKLPDQVNTHGISKDAPLPDIKDADGVTVIAKGYAGQDDTVRYVFENTVNNKENISLKLNFPVFIDPIRVPNDQVDIELITSINNVMGKKSISVQYGRNDNNGVYQQYLIYQGKSLKSTIYEADASAKTFKQVIYVNPLRHNDYLKQLQGTISNDGTKFTKEKTKITIYEVKSNDKLNDSLYINELNSALKLEKVELTPTYSNNSYILDFNRYIFNPYVVIVESDYNPNANLQIDTTSQYSSWYNGWYNTILEFENDIKLYNGDGTGFGDQVQPQMPPLEGQPIADEPIPYIPGDYPYPAPSLEGSEVIEEPIVFPVPELDGGPVIDIDGSPMPEPELEELPDLVIPEIPDVEGEVLVGIDGHPLTEEPNVDLVVIPELEEAPVVELDGQEIPEEFPAFEEVEIPEIEEEVLIPPTIEEPTFEIIDMPEVEEGSVVELDGQEIPEELPAFEEVEIPEIEEEVLIPPTIEEPTFEIIDIPEVEEAPLVELDGQEMPEVSTPTIDFDVEEILDQPLLDGQEVPEVTVPTIELEVEVMPELPILEDEKPSELPTIDFSLEEITEASTLDGKEIPEVPSIDFEVEEVLEQPILDGQPMPEPEVEFSELEIIIEGESFEITFDTGAYEETGAYPIQTDLVIEEDTETSLLIEISYDTVFEESGQYPAETLVTIEEESDAAPLVEFTYDTVKEESGQYPAEPLLTIEEDTEAEPIVEPDFPTLSEDRSIELDEEGVEEENTASEDPERAVETTEQKVSSAKESPKSEQRLLVQVQPKAMPKSSAMTLPKMSEKKDAKVLFGFILAAASMLLALLSFKNKRKSKG
ncbi:Ig-like domain-containing protein [Streptococcus catagoni]|uniref:Ig-like domain-containing protein n=1 Tax=Streptococcus catagoni TaxID=2654874 RepID=UPI00140AE833|nr:Ig-like domain-containing protein [Streptococcus catagoni]